MVETYRQVNEVPPCSATGSLNEKANNENYAVTKVIPNTYLQPVRVLSEPSYYLNNLRDVREYGF